METTTLKMVESERKPSALSIADTAYEFGVNRQLISKLVAQGKIKSIRLGQRRIVIPMAEINHILEHGLPE